jgi:hypothetical protein
VVFEGLVSNQYGTFDHITKKTMDDLGYAYIYCELLDWAGLTMITLWVKSPHVQMHENVFQKWLYVNVKNFGIEVRSQRGFEKGDMPIILTMESITILLSITTFEHALIPMFFHLIFSKNSDLSHYSPSFPPILLLSLLPQ